MKTKSFSLVELLVTVAILTIIGSILIAFVRNTYTLYYRGQYLSLTKTEADTLTTRIANALRGTYQVVSADASQITVLSYFAPADATPTQVTITKTGANITLSTIIGVASGSTYTYDPGTATTRTINTHFVTNPATPLFQYESEMGTLNLPISLPAVHLVTVSSTIFSTYNSTYTTTSSTKVNLRNLKTNL
ncbi:MAG: hypothetical protein WC773_03965 [Patescibacteria group bacterium]|jgi:hypothetical protein